MLSSLIDRFLKGIDDAASASVLQAHLEMLKESAEILEKENDSLKAENSHLKERLANMEQLEQQLALLNQFEDLGVIKIKLDKHGRRLPSCYCPQCGGLIANPENLNEDQRRLGQYGVHICLNNCGYRISPGVILQALYKWDTENQEK